MGESTFFVFKELEKIPGFVHAFTSRQPYSSKDADQSGQVASEKELLVKALAIRMDQVVLLRQVHSNRVITVRNRPGNDFRPTSIGPADGVITLDLAQFPVVRTADCLPILAVLAKRKQVCVLHAGWRGTRDRITSRGITQLLEVTQTSPAELIVAIGPGIQKCCYQVGSEVRSEYKRAGHDVDRFFDGDRLDLVEANRSQLQELGVNNILDSNMCTACRTDLFYSYRREGETGRNWLLAGFKRE